MKETIKLIIDNNILEKYNSYYFSIHPKAKKKPIPNPHHPTINTWMIMKRPAMNNLKQKWKAFIIWYIDFMGYSNLNIDSCDLVFSTFYKINRRRDVDNIVPKFILDGFVEAGFVVDDDSKHIKSLTLKCGVDKENPRTEIEVRKINE